MEIGKPDKRKVRHERLRVCALLTSRISHLGLKEKTKQKHTFKFQRDSEVQSFGVSEETKTRIWEKLDKTNG